MQEGDDVRRALDLLCAPSSDAPLSQQRRLVGDILIANNAPPDDALFALMDAILSRECDASAPLDVETGEFSDAALGFDCEGARVMVWRGDITRLVADAIVNAANEQGLGCFQPSHVSSNSLPSPLVSTDSPT
jgi:hypothetical protein